MDELKKLLIDFAADTVTDKISLNYYHNRSIDPMLIIKPAEAYFNSLVTLLNDRSDSYINERFDKFMAFKTHDKHCLLDVIVRMSLFAIKNIEITKEQTIDQIKENVRNLLIQNTTELKPCDHPHEPIDGPIYSFEIN